MAEEVSPADRPAVRWREPVCVRCFSLVCLSCPAISNLLLAMFLRGVFALPWIISISHSRCFSLACFYCPYNLNFPLVMFLAGLLALPWHFPVSHSRCFSLGFLRCPGNFQPLTRVVFPWLAFIAPAIFSL